MTDLNELVKKILTDHPEARDDDFKVIGWVIQRISPNAMSMRLSAVLWNHNALKIPSFETVRRTRQKIQHDHPELRGQLYKKRMEKQDEYVQKFSEVG